MTIEGLTAEEKIQFLDVLIGKTNPDYKEHFYALYIVLGDDLFLLFSILTSLNIRFPDMKDFRSAQIAAGMVSKRKVPGTTKTGRVKTVTIPQVIGYLDMTALENLTFWHMETKVQTPYRELQKMENYFSEGLSEIICPLSGVRQILGREWLLYTTELKTVELPNNSVLDSEYDEGPEDMIR